MPAVSDFPPATTVLRAPRSVLRFYHGDCLDVLPLMPQGSVTTVVTSPPYNLGIPYRTYQDSLSGEDYLVWTEAWVRSAARTLTPDGSLFLNVGSKPTRPWIALDVAQAVRPHLHLQNIIHWVKSIVIERDAAGISAGLKRDLAVGHYKPINSRRFLNDCQEFVFHFTPAGRTLLDRRSIGVKYQDSSNVARWKAAAGGRRCRGNVWFIPYETIQNRDQDRPHPATFPPKLPEYCLRVHGIARSRLVLDPFLGLGSTAIACARLGVDFVGIELDKDYLAEAVARTTQALTPSKTAARLRQAR